MAAPGGPAAVFGALRRGGPAWAVWALALCSVALPPPASADNTSGLGYRYLTGCPETWMLEGTGFTIELRRTVPPDWLYTPKEPVSA